MLMVILIYTFFKENNDLQALEDTLYLGFCISVLNVILNLIQLNLI